MNLNNVTQVLGGNHRHLETIARINITFMLGAHSSVKF